MLGCGVGCTAAYSVSAAGSCARGAWFAGLHVVHAHSLTPPPVSLLSQGLAKAVAAGFLDASPNNGGAGWRFPIDEYEHYEQVGV